MSNNVNGTMSIVLVFLDNKWVLNLILIDGCFCENYLFYQYGFVMFVFAFYRSFCYNIFSIVFCVFVFFNEITKT